MAVWETTAPEADARLVEWKHFANKGSDGTIRLIREWPNVNAQNAKGVAYAWAAIVIDPKADGITYTGTFQVVPQNLGEQQRSNTLRQVLVLSDTDGLTMTWDQNCDMKISQIFKWDLTYTQTLAIATTYVDSSDGVTVNISTNENSDGLFDAVITTRTRQYRPHSARYSVYSNDAYTQTDERLGVYADTYIPSIYGAKQGQLYRQQVQIKDDCTKDVTTDFTTSRTDAIYFGSRRTQFSHTDEAVYANWRTLIAAPTPDSGVYDATNQLQPDGTYNARLVYKIGVNSSSAEFASRRENAENADEALYRGRNSQIDAPSSGVRGLYEARNNLREDGLYDATMVYRTSVSKEADFSSERTPFRVSTSHLYENREGVVSAPEVESGLYRAENRVNPDGTYNGSLIYACGTDSGEAEFLVTDSADSMSREILYKSRTSPVDAIADGAGYVYEARNSLGDDGLYDASLIYNASKPVVLDVRTQNTWTKNEHSLIYNNAATVPTVPSVGQRGVYRMSGLRQNRDGTYDAALIYDTSEARSFETSFTDEKATVYLYRYENKSDLTLPPVSPYSRNSVSGISWNPDQTYTFSVVSKSLVGTGGIQTWNDSDAQVYLKKAGDTGKYYYFSKIFTHNKSEAENFMSGTGNSTYGTKAAGSTIVGYYDSHVTNYSWQGATRFISTRVDLME